MARVASFQKPLERDTGTYLYIGDLVLHGQMPYADGADNKGPLTFLLFALIRLVSGTSVVMVRITLLLFVAAAALGLAVLVASYAGRAAGLLAGFAFALLASMQPWEGDDPNTEQYGVAFMVGAWALATRPSRWAAVAAGATLAGGVAVNALFLVATPFVTFELWRSGRFRQLGFAAAGFAAVILPIVLWLVIGGAWDDYRDQVFHDDLFSRPGGTGLLSDHGVFDLLDVPAGSLVVVALAAAAMAARRRDLRPLAAACALWIGAVWLKTELQSYSFPHHWYVALPAVVAALALGIASVWPADLGARVAVAALVLAVPVVAMVLGPQFRELQIPGHDRWAVDAQSTDDWGLSYPVADFIARHTGSDDRILMAGSNPEVYWLAKRRAASRYFSYFIPLRDPGAAAERAADLERRPPAAIGAMVNGDANADIQTLMPFLEAHGYRLSYKRQGARVWLRS